MSIASTSDLERRIAVKVQSGRYGSQNEVIEASLALLEAHDTRFEASPAAEARPVWETIAQLGREIPTDDWVQVPADLSIS